MTLELDPTILRQYDIRGIVGKNLSPDVAHYLARLLANLLPDDDKKIVVGGDGRLSTQVLKQSLILGFLECGVSVIELEGVVATPELYYADYIIKPPMALQVTGSHNPSEYNGFKITKQQKPFWGQDIQKLAEMKPLPTSPKKGEHVIKNYRTQYITDILKNLTLPDAIKVGWDCGNGATSLSLATLLPKLKGEHHVIYGEVDGNFPHHHPDPTVEKNLADLKKLVKEKSLDLGIGFDGDGDRIGVVDEDGVALWGDQLLTFYSQVVLEKNKAATIIADVKASQVFFDEVKKMGGRAVMAPTGHSIIKTEMKKQSALLAGEMSGHIFFADRWAGFDDALYAALRLLEVLAIKKTSLKKLRQSLPMVFNTPEIRIEVKEEEKWSIMDHLKRKLQDEKIAFNDLDGIRVDDKDGWWLIRASNTQNCLVARAESQDKEKLNNLLQKIKNYLLAVGCDNSLG